jgi:hypothetical protein
MHFTIEQHLATLSDMVEKVAESLEETVILINELHQFEINSKVSSLAYLFILLWNRAECTKD